MKKAEIIAALMSRNVVSERVLTAVQNSITDAAADQRLAKLEGRRALIEKVKIGFIKRGLPCTFLAFALVGGYFVSGDSAAKTVDIITASALVGIFGCMAAAILALISLSMAAGFSNIYDAHWLQKIAGTVYCERALRHLEASSDAGAWRDIALAERAELRVFDVEIMEALADLQSSASARQAALARYEEACKKVHGIPA